MPITQNTHHATLSDDQKRAREAMHAARDARIQDAWKNPPTGAVTQQAQTPSAAARPATYDREAFYAARDQRLSNAWKGAR